MALIGLALLAAAALTSLSARDLSRPPTRAEVAHRLLAQGRPALAGYLFEDPAWRGYANHRAGRYARAVEALVQDRTAVSFYNLGGAYARIGFWDPAVAAFENALRLDPGLEDARFNLDLTLRARDRARQIAAEAVRPLDPGDMRAERTGFRDQRDDDAEGGGGAPAQSDRAEGPAAAEDATGTGDGVSDGAGQGGRQSDDGRGFGLIDEAARARNIAGSAAGRRAMEREAGQATEILLGRIRDDPAEVLRERLRNVWRARQARSGE